MAGINLKKAFTLLEILMVVLILGLVLPSILQLYTFITQTNREISLRQTAIRQSYEFFERLNVMMQDYTIDYEEYYNRKMVGCVKSGTQYQGESFKWNIGKTGHCTEFTNYGNGNSTNRGRNSSKIVTGYHDIYYCSSEMQSDGISNSYGYPRVVKNYCGNLSGWQSFGQYAALQKDVHDAVLVGSSNPYGDADDRDTGNLIVDAIGDHENVKELYLISQDGKKRLLFRRTYITSISCEALYRIQMLRLRGFDAGQKHDFSVKDNEGVYDGKIDTWACDASLGFTCQGSALSGGGYPDYKMPKDINDGRIDMTQGGVTIKAWNMIISPLNDPDVVWAEDDLQINPLVQFLMVAGIYTPYYLLGGSSSMQEFSVPIQTSFNLKSFYSD